MDFKEVIAKRRSIRGYTGNPISEEKLAELYKALQIAPSGSNRQDFRFIFITDEKIREEITSKACHQDFVVEAPVIMVATCKNGYEFSTAIAVDHMVLAATNMGLGSCLIGWFEIESIRDILNIPKDINIPIIVSLGYAAVSPSDKPRKSLGDLIGENTY